MNLRCPHCGTDIKVAGFYFRNETSAEGRSENKPIPCHSCGREFMPERQKITSPNDKK
jgi:hypothetical protein